MKKITYYFPVPLLLSYVLLTGGILWVLFQILKINGGFFAYPLDDTYIHLAVAENIIRGTYGVNLGEFSSPSSSILWPFLLAPFAKFVIAPLILNILAAFCTVYVYYLILDHSFNIIEQSRKQIVVFLFLILLILGTNIIPLIILGLEHSLQVLSVAVICWGLILNIKHDEIKPWLVASIVIAPLIRYENGAISFAAIIFLFLRKNYRMSLLTSLAAVISLVGFTAFLRANGQGWLPASVLVKTGFTGSNGSMFALFGNFIENIQTWSGAVILVSAIILLIYLFLSKNDLKKKLALVLIISAAMFLALGKVGGARYEVHIWAFVLLGIIFIFGEPVSQIFKHQRSRSTLAIVSSTAITVLAFASLPYLFLFPLWHVGSNNIYSQQYQMHRFVVDYFKGPVAVNDIGYVSYKNDFYVLDLWGLASLEAFRYRSSDNAQQWMDNLAASKNIQLAMIYESWFGQIPPNWDKVGDLVLTGERITIPDARVAFYALTPSARTEIEEDLREFIKTLPDTAKFEFAEQ